MPLGCEVFCGSQQNENHYTPSLVRQGKEDLGGLGEENRGMHGVNDSPVCLTENRHVAFCMAALPGILILPTDSSLSLVFCSFSPRSPLQIVERGWALTPTLVEMKEEITALICAYFAFF